MCNTELKRGDIVIVKSDKGKHKIGEILKFDNFLEDDVAYVRLTDGFINQASVDRLKLVDMNKLIEE